MIYKKKPSEVEGLWCRKDNKFYYLETGVHSVRNPLDRLRNTLISRGLVDINITGTRLGEEPLKKMSWARAKELSYDVEPIYVNSHVEEQVKAAQGNGPAQTANPWK